MKALCNGYENTSMVPYRNFAKRAKQTEEKHINYIGQSRGGHMRKVLNMEIFLIKAFGMQENGNLKS